MVIRISVWLIIGLIFTGCLNPEESKEVLFVCTHGAARSPIATAYFNEMSKEKGLRYHAVFRGTEPDKTLMEETVLGLTKDGFNISKWSPLQVNDQDISRAHLIVTFDCVLPEFSKDIKVENWTGIPPISKDYDLARNAIRDKVALLITDLNVSN